MCSSDLMSGTSLDGVDLAYCRFKRDRGKWTYRIIHSKTVHYPEHWKKKLREIGNKDAKTFVHAHKEYGKYIGKIANEFIIKNDLKVDFISSHGHTIFHAPAEKITFQLGDGAAIAAQCKLTVVCDFRSMDVELGGQGAPLVPVGDRLLFGEYDYCLNLGGFANISYDNDKNERVAHDICPVNIVLNELAQKCGCAFDNMGKIAASGKIKRPLLDKLNALAFYEMLPPKSLGKEWVIMNFNSPLDKTKISVEDKLSTITEHIAIQLTSAIDRGHLNNRTKNIPANCKVLVTGGGAHNKYLVDRIKSLSSNKIVIPYKELVDYKEALIFAFLGVLRMNNEINCLKSATGASEDNIGGNICYFNC